MQKLKTTRRVLAVLLSLVMALGLTVSAFASLEGAPAETYVDGSGMQAVNMPVTGAKVLDLSDVPDCCTVKVYDDGGAGDCIWSMSNLEWNVPRDTGLFVSSGNTLLIHFYGAELYTCEGIEFTVTVDSGEQEHNVNLVDVDNYDHCLIMAADSARVGETVSILVFNITGFVLTDITVRD